jgi:hypothetical protein
MTTSAVRIAWILAHVLCLVVVTEHRWRYHRWWRAYLTVSAPVAVIYSVHLNPDGQPTAFWKFYGTHEAYLPMLMVAVLLLRTLAALEALHYQTCDFPWWSRMMAGAFLFAGFVVICLDLVRDDRWVGLQVEYRRYLQIWTFLVMAITEMLMISVSWWRDRRQDWHVAALLAMTANHARVSIFAMTAHPTGIVWHEANWIATAVDTAVLLCWALARHSDQLASRPRHATA